MVVKGAPASEAIGGPAYCGNYTVASSWSSQFGIQTAFTTLSVINYATDLIIYPAYRDTQLEGGRVVTPDQSYIPEHLP